MASHKLNIARIRGCPAAKDVDALLEQYGLPERQEHGVLKHSATSEYVNAVIIRRTNQSVPVVDEASKEVTTAQVERVTAYPFAIIPGKELLEVYAGAASGIKEVAAFLSTCLALNIVVEQVELDILGCLEKLAKNTQKFQLRSIRVNDFSHNSYTIGPYTPRFTDTEHGKDFLEEYAEAVTAASVRFKAKNGNANVRLAPIACFGYSCADEDGQTIKALLRSLA